MAGGAARLRRPPGAGHRWPRSAPVGGQPTHPEAQGWPLGLHSFQTSLVWGLAGNAGPDSRGGLSGVCSSGSCLPEPPELGRSWGHSAAPPGTASPQPQSGLGGFAQVPPLVSGSKPHFWFPSPSFSTKQHGLVHPPLPTFLCPLIHHRSSPRGPELGWAWWGPRNESEMRSSLKSPRPGWGTEG